jgi:hypothetical protein
MFIAALFTIAKLWKPPRCRAIFKAGYCKTVLAFEFSKEVCHKKIAIGSFTCFFIIFLFLPITFAQWGNIL